MKKIYSFAFAAVAILSAASCQEELANEALENIGGGNFTVTAATAETKTALAEDGFGVVWTPGDKISLINAEGNAVPFSTDITEKSATAEFTNEADYIAPEDGTLYAVYPHRVDDKDGITPVQYQIANTKIIKNFRVGSPQQAIAGSFDPEFGSAIGVQKEAGSTEFVFKSINALVKFKVTGDTAPTTISLKSHAMRMCVGLWWYNIETGECQCDQGGHEVQLTAPEGGFKVGDTYYIALVPGPTKNLTLYFDGVAVKSLGEQTVVTLEANKIYNFGEVEVSTVEPEPEPEQPQDLPFNITRVWGKYSTTEPWYNFGVDPNAATNLDRGMAMDTENIYVSKTTAYAPVITAFPLDGSESFNINVTGMGSNNTWGDTMEYSVNALNTIKKADGTYVLIACNLKNNANQILELWAWVDGVEAAPTCIGRYAYDSVANAQDHRRYGDRMSVTGTWEEGKIWLPSMQADDHGKTIVFETKAGVDNSNRPVHYYRMEPSQSAVKELTFYSGADGEVFSTSNKVSAFVQLDGTTHSTGWVNWTKTDDYSTTHLRTFGYNFFEVDNQKYIAFVKIDAENGNTGRLVIIKDGDGTLAGFKKALTDNVIVCEFPIQHESSLTTPAYQTTANTLGSCKLIEINGEKFLGAHIQGLGCSLFKITSK